MTDIVVIAPRAGLSIEPMGRHERPVNVREAAAQFEALLIAQMLKSAREGASAGWSGEEEDDASTSALAMAEEHLAQVLSAGGGLGLARLVVKGLENRPAGEKPEKATPPRHGAAR